VSPSSTSDVAMTAETALVLSDVNHERRRQVRKWGEQHHDDAWWCVIEMEELGEVAKEVFDGYSLGSNDPNYVARLREELVQVAAVAVAWVEDIDSR